MVDIYIYKLNNGGEGPTCLRGLSVVLRARACMDEKGERGQRTDVSRQDWLQGLTAVPEARRGPLP